MENPIEYSTHLPMKFETWTDFYQALYIAGQAEHEVVHYLRALRVGGLKAFGSSNDIAFEEEHYEMKYVIQQYLSEQNVQENEEGDAS